MDAKEVLAAAQSWVNALPNQRLVSAIGNQSDFAGHIRAFESGIGQLVDASKEDNGFTEFGLAVPFSAVESGADESYRRALKKYTSSPVFNDLNISIILVRDDKSLEVISAADVNGFLAQLNQLVRKYKETH